MRNEEGYAEFEFKIFLLFFAILFLRCCNLFDKRCILLFLLFLFFFVIANFGFVSWQYLVVSTKSLRDQDRNKSGENLFLYQLRLKRYEAHGWDRRRSIAFYRAKTFPPRARICATRGKEHRQQQQQQQMHSFFRLVEFARDHSNWHKSDERETVTVWHHCTKVSLP